MNNQMQDIDIQETEEWIESLEAVLEEEGVERAHFILEKLIEAARQNGANLPYSARTAYINTIPAHLEHHTPGNRTIESRLRSYIRWNAAAMVVRAAMPDGSGLCQRWRASSGGLLAGRLVWS